MQIKTYTQHVCESIKEVAPGCGIRGEMENVNLRITDQIANTPPPQKKKKKLLTHLRTHFHSSLTDRGGKLLYQVEVFSAFIAALFILPYEPNSAPEYS